VNGDAEPTQQGIIRTFVEIDRGTEMVEGSEKKKRLYLQKELRGKKLYPAKRETAPAKWEGQKQEKQRKKNRFC